MLSNIIQQLTQVMPGDSVKCTIELIRPMPLHNGLRFALREGGRTIASGIVSNITK